MNKYVINQHLFKNLLGTDYRLIKPYYLQSQ
jgi:hypothetical protein